MRWSHQCLNELTTYRFDQPGAVLIIHAGWLVLVTFALCFSWIIYTIESWNESVTHGLHLFLASGHLF